MLTDNHLQSWGIPSESTLLFSPEALAISWRRFVNGLDQAPLSTMCLVLTLSLTPFLNVASTSLQM